MLIILLTIMEILFLGVSSTCIPHILPILRYFENPYQKIPHTTVYTKLEGKKQLSASEGNILGSVAHENVETSVIIVL